MLAYVHNLDPVALPIYGNLALRWYGLAYLLGFVGAWWLLREMARRRLWVLAPERTADFIAAAALFGVFLGGRLGYVLFYQIPREGVAEVLGNPLGLLKVWEGGMASHGGILGLVVFSWFYAKRAGVSWTGLGDGLCLAAPIGIFCGRVANFINGELYGRAASIPWAVKFPLSLGEESEATQAAAWQACERVSPVVLDGTMAGLLDAVRSYPVVAAELGNFLTPRHPSQIYAALLEGLLLFVILLAVRLRWKGAPHGLLTAIFFGGYAVFRILGEIFREPDAAWVIDGWVTRGQFLSGFMLIAAALFFRHALRGRRCD
ncbi:MAG: prolipoprotein diacylglyceryl transferase [Luteolibacter sp.]|jgi:phosphatidylglycerol---prolipoprotein diacylglyceryl transferase